MIWSITSTFVIAGDGCLMEGINHEAIGLAGHLKLGHLNVLWDNNHITIDGDTSVSTSETSTPATSPPVGMWWNATATISPMSSARSGSGRRSASLADRLPHDHRQGRAQQAGRP
jgi:hypothetical protein